MSRPSVATERVGTATFSACRRSGTDKKLPVQRRRFRGNRPALGALDGDPNRHDFSLGVTRGTGHRRPFFFDAPRLVNDIGFGQGSRNRGSTLNTICRFLAASIVVAAVTPLSAQLIRPVRTFATEGLIKSVGPGRIAVADKTGKSWQMRFSTRPDGRVALGKNRFFSARKPSVQISGSLPIQQLEKGFMVRCECTLDERTKKISKPVSKISWLDDRQFKLGVKVDRKQRDDEGVACTVSGVVEGVRRGRLFLDVGRSKYASNGKMLVPLEADSRFDLKSHDLSKVQEGDRVTKASGVELNTGDFIIQELTIRVVDNRSESNQKQSPEPETKKLDQKYERLSDELVAPRDVRSQHYILHTDISDREAKMLLDRLEEMLGFVSRYYGRPQSGVVECYVVADMKQWPPTFFTEEVKQKIANKEGLTQSISAVSSLGGRRSKSTVFTGNLPGVVQHEAVHAYCNLTFGSSGPTWYSEGMAEMGQYWKESQREVDVDPRVIKYIRRSKSPKELKEIVRPGQITGDAWEAYAWRWALCHLLANNPNYSRTFKQLGIGLMSKKPGVSFTSAYGRKAKQLMFEYDHFVKHVDNGYRADLCAWRWKHRFKELRGKGHETFKVEAKYGWQPALRVMEEAEYDYICKGEWLLDGTGTKAGADGHDKLGGQLSAVVMTDYELGEPIQLGAQGSFKAPATGDLYLRCEEDWTRLGDNSGSISVHIRLAR